MVAPVYQGSEVKLLGDGSSHHYKDPSEEMVAPVFQGSGVKLLGDALIKKKRKFSSYIGKFGVEQLQSHI
jgi:hypothetical protein